MSLETEIQALRFEQSRKATMLRPDNELETPIPNGSGGFITTIEYDADPNLISRADALQHFPTYISGKYSIFFAQLGARYNQYSDGGKLWICTKKATATTNPIWSLISTTNTEEPAISFTIANGGNAIQDIANLVANTELMIDVAYHIKRGNLSERGNMQMLSSKTDIIRTASFDDAGIRFTASNANSKFTITATDILTNGTASIIKFYIKIRSLSF